MEDIVKHSVDLWVADEILMIWSDFIRIADLLFEYYWQICKKNL